MTVLHEADRFSIFRKDVKEFLQKYNKVFDKFTTTDHDSYLGYITEDEICKSQIIHANEYTKYHTKSQIDNYNTSLKNYKDIENLKTMF